MSQVAFLRTWFANNKVDKFSVSVWFKRDGQKMYPKGIVHNGDCEDTAGFAIGHSNGMVMANITTEAGHEHCEVSAVNAHSIISIYTCKHVRKRANIHAYTYTLSHIRKKRGGESATQTRMRRYGRTWERLL